MGADILKLYTSYRGDRFQVPTRLTTVTRHTGEYKVDVTCHPKFPLAFGELASGGFPHCIWLFIMLYEHVDIPIRASLQVNTTKNTDTQNILLHSFIHLG